MAEQVRVHTNVHDVHFHMVEPGKHIDRRSSGKEIEHHLLRYLRWIGAHPFGRDAVIRGKHVNRLC